MSFLVIFSLIVKVFGSGLEILSQALISQGISVEAYGTYAFFVTIAEGIYSLFFSGVIKFNNYYIPQGQDVSGFRRKLYLKYALPIGMIGLLIAAVLNQIILAIAIVAALLYFCAMDRSSRMMSFGRYRQALIGEYCIGRIVVLLGIGLVVLLKTDRIELLYIVYAVQFVVAIVYYRVVNYKADRISSTQPAQKQLDQGAVKKYATFQSTEIAHTITMQTSVIVQYLFVGAYETALVSIVLVVRKLINFITGPTSKLYQPEFSRKYHENDISGLADVYAQITRTQLCFILPAFTILLGRPELLLKIYNSELVEYGYLVRYTSIVFLVMIAFGPLANFLCMTGHEKSDTISNWVSVFVMYIVMFLFQNSTYFVVYGFCAQIIVTTIYKLTIYLKYMRKPPMALVDYIKLFVITAVALILLLILPSNIMLCLLICVLQFVLNFVLVFPRDELRELISKITRKTKNK